MLFENHMGKDFENLGQRLTYVLAVQMSPLKTIENSTVGVDAQKDLYTFICDYYKAVFDNPAIVGLDYFPDECENKTYEGKHYLETRKLMRKLQKKITDVFDWLILCGNLGYVKSNELGFDKKEAKLTKKKLEIFQSLGLEIELKDNRVSMHSPRYPKMMSALKYVSGISPVKNSYMYIFRGIFDTEYNYYPDVYKEHCPFPEVFDKVVTYVRANGFKEDFQISDSLHNMKWGFVRTHNDMEFRFSCQYDVRYYYHLLFTFIDDKKVVRWVLENFSVFDEQIQDLFFEKNKKCNKCGYCNQTDKRRPLVCITVNYKGENVELCPYFQFLRCYFLPEDYVDKVLHFFDYALNN